MNDARTLPARIVQFDPATQTATIKVSAERVYTSETDTEELYDWVELDQVPVHMPSGGNFHMTFPVSIGDPCLVVFSQVGYDHWFVKDLDTAGKLVEQPQPHLKRSFSVEDGFALVGFKTLPRVLTGYSATDAVWRNTVNDTHITIRENGTVGIIAPVGVDITTPMTTVNGNMTILGDVTHTGNMIHTGDNVQVGNYTVTGTVNLLQGLGVNGLLKVQGAIQYKTSNSQNTNVTVP